MIYDFDTLFPQMRYPAGESHIKLAPGPIAPDALIVAPHIRNCEFERVFINGKAEAPQHFGDIRQRVRDGAR